MKFCLETNYSWLLSLQKLIKIRTGAHTKICSEGLDYESEDQTKKDHP